jgi:ribosomal protein S8
MKFIYKIACILKVICNFACETKVIIICQMTKSMRKVLTVLALTGILASCGVSQTKSTSEVNQK